jgi:cytochrome b involved in lipid metabolism
LDDHPGGAEVMLDVSGQNADEFFEDIGHSQDARKELEKHVIGIYKMTEEELEKMRIDAENRQSKGGVSPSMILLIAIIAIIYAYTQDLI